MNHRFQRQGLLGTVVDVRLSGSVLTPRTSRQAAGFLLAEMERLEAVFTAFDDASELGRWRQASSTEVPSEEFCTLMARVLHWWSVSDGAFNPLTGRLSRLWAEAAESGRRPDDRTRTRLVAAIRRPCFAMVDGVPVVDGNCRDLSLNAIAKGFIVDRSLDAMDTRLGSRRRLIDTVVVNAGGDIGHRGRRPARVGIENPLRLYDNEPPLAVVELHNQAIATSGGGRRGFEIDGRRYNHLLDPGTGLPVDHSASVTVVASDAATADVVATAAAVMAPEQAVAWVDSLSTASIGPISALAVEPDGTRRTTSRWTDLSR